MIQTSDKYEWLLSLVRVARYRPFPRRWDSKYSSKYKSKSSMAKVQVSFEMSHLKRDLWWPWRISLCIPMTISSLIFSGTGCTSGSTYYRFQKIRVTLVARIIHTSDKYKWLLSLVGVARYEWLDISQIPKNTSGSCRPYDSSSDKYEWLLSLVRVARYEWLDTLHTFQKIRVALVTRMIRRVTSTSGCCHTYEWQEALVLFGFCDTSLVLQGCNKGWLQLVGSLKLYVTFAKEPYKRDYILQKRPVIAGAY